MGGELNRALPERFTSFAPRRRRAGPADRRRLWGWVAPSLRGNRAYRVVSRAGAYGAPGCLLAGGPASRRGPVAGAVRNGRGREGRIRRRTPGRNDVVSARRMGAGPDRQGRIYSSAPRRSGVGVFETRSVGRNERGEITGRLPAAIPPDMLPGRLSSDGTMVQVATLRRG